MPAGGPYLNKFVPKRPVKGKPSGHGRLAFFIRAFPAAADSAEYRDILVGYKAAAQSQKSCEAKRRLHAEANADTP